MGLYISFMKQHFALKKKEKITDSLNKSEKQKKAHWYIVYKKALKEKDKENTNISMLISNYVEKKAKLSLQYIINDAYKQSKAPHYYLDAFFSKIILLKSKLDEKQTMLMPTNEYNKLFPGMGNKKSMKIVITGNQSEEEIKQEDKAIIKKVKNLKIKSINEAQLILYHSFIKKNYHNIKSRFKQKKSKYLLVPTTRQERFGNSAFSNNNSINLFDLRTFSPVNLTERLLLKSNSNTHGILLVNKPVQVIKMRRNQSSSIANRKKTVKLKLFSFWNRNDFYF